MIRKLIQLSPSTAVISLPSDWIKRNKLKKGDSITVEERDNQVVVSTENKKSEKAITLDVSKLSDRIFWAYIAAAYEAGYDHITFLTSGPEQSAFVAKTSKWFPGMIVYEERRNTVQFKDLAENTQGELDKVLNRVFNLIIAMLEDGVEATKKKDWEVLSKMKLRDFTVNSYVSYCQRQLSKFGFSPFSKVGAMHTYLKMLELISDKISAFMESMGSSKKGETKLLEALLNIFRSIHRMHFGFSQERLLEVEQERKKLVQNEQIVDLTSLLYGLEELELQFQV